MENREFEKSPISVLMVIHNEEALLERALLSCADIADEIIIVHDGKCTDRSLEIARKYTDQIFELDRAGHSERHRVKTLETAKNDWIVQLDADEYLSSDLRVNLKKMISGKTDIYEVSWSTFHKNKHYFWHHKRMIFRKSKVYFVGVIHEYVKPIDGKIIIEKTQYALMHKPAYNNLTFATFRKKWKKWAKIHAEELTNDFSSAPKWNCPLNDWEYRNKIRARHPILLGVTIVPLFHLAFSIKNFAIHRKFYMLKLGFFAFLYHSTLHYYLAKLKRKRKQYLYKG